MKAEFYVTMLIFIGQVTWLKYENNIVPLVKMLDVTQIVSPTECKRTQSNSTSSSASSSSERDSVVKMGNL